MTCGKIGEMKVGDLVRMKRGYSAHGVVIDIRTKGILVQDGAWVKVLWSDAGRGSELMKDLEVIQYGNR